MAEAKCGSRSPDGLLRCHLPMHHEGRTHLARLHPEATEELEEQVDDDDEALVCWSE
jgi:hypothetical protein